MQIIISIMSIAMIVLMGNKWKHAPLIGLINQIFWAIYLISTKQYGLMISTAAYTFVHIRNYYKWLKD